MEVINDIRIYFGNDPLTVGEFWSITIIGCTLFGGLLLKLRQLHLKQKNAPIWDDEDLDAIWAQMYGPKQPEIKEEPLEEIVPEYEILED